MLRVVEAVKGFGGITAVNHCSLEVIEGSITGLIGPNGAGKSTLFDLITGFQKLDEGEIYYKDECVDGLPSHELALRG
ncbi:MAG: ATP-binding cassette domain-containing protein, partial [Candidatus Hydrothermarchaeota archaeon]|nr:ATP-binding cassette domain-containing protein [Candidatus Hydrothermarchaeota archaeon]